MEEPNNICKDCGSDEVFVKCDYPDIDKPLYQCFDCYCEAYEHYMSNDDEDYRLESCPDYNNK